MNSDSWSGLELRHLLALQAISEEGSFGRAARRLGYTQSAVSQQVAALERIVGAQLVERPGGPRPVTLTEAGRVVLGHADAIGARLSAAQADLAALRAGEAGPLRVGTFQSVGTRVLPRLLRRFASELPQVEVQLAESPDDGELVELVERGELDLAFVLLPLDPGPFEAVELLRDPYVLVVPAGSPLALRERAPALKEVAALPLISFRLCRSTETLEAALRATGREPHVVFRSDNNGTVQGLVVAGVGAAVMPRLTVDPSDRSVAVIDLGERVPPRLIGLAWHADRRRTRAAEAFVASAQALCAERDAGSAAA